MLKGMVTKAYILPIEFDFRALGDGRSASARYANNSNYRNDSLIRKESMLIRLWVYCSGIDRFQCVSARS